MKRVALLCLCVAACVALTGCSGGGAAKKPERTANPDSGEIQFTALAEGESIAVIVTDLGEIRIRLFPQAAPMAVENFIGLAQQGYYNGVSFHRVVKDFLIHTGDATGTGTGGTTVWNGTPYAVELTDTLHHYTGAVGIAHAPDDTGGNSSQFYIVQTPKNSIDKAAAKNLTELGMREAVADAYRAVGGAPYLDNFYTVFAQVYEGMDIVDKIASVACNENGQPTEPVLIQSVTIESYTAPVASSTPPASDASAQGGSAPAQSGASSTPAASATDSAA